jgi:hypothetical protein
MNYTIQLFVVNPVTSQVMLSGKPLVLKFASLAEAREKVALWRDEMRGSPARICVAHAMSYPRVRLFRRPIRLLQ